MAIKNCSINAQIGRMRQRGWIERNREPRPEEGRVLITPWHPRQTIGEGCDRYYAALSL